MMVHQALLLVYYGLGEFCRLAWDPESQVGTTLPAVDRQT